MQRTSYNPVKKKKKLSRKKRKKKGKMRQKVLIRMHVFHYILSSSNKRLIDGGYDLESTWIWNTLVGKMRNETKFVTA